MAFAHFRLFPVSSNADRKLLLLPLQETTALGDFRFFFFCLPHMTHGWSFSLGIKLTGSGSEIEASGLRQKSIVVFMQDTISVLLGQSLRACLTHPITQPSPAVDFLIHQYIGFCHSSENGTQKEAKWLLIARN